MIEVCKKCGAEKDSETVFCDGCVAKSGSSPVPFSGLDLGHPKFFMLRPRFNDGDQEYKIVLRYESEEDAEWAYDQLKAQATKAPPVNDEN